MATYSIIADIFSSVTGGLFRFVRDALTSDDPLLISPATVLANYLRGTSLTTHPDSEEAWPLYISYEPDSPTNVASVYDSTGVKQGRLMIGTVIQNYGIQVRIRNSKYNLGWAKAEAIALDLDTIHNEIITIDSEDYIIKNIERQGPVVSLGKEKGTKKRNLFTINLLVTLKKV